MKMMKNIYLLLCFNISEVGCSGFFSSIFSSNNTPSNNASRQVSIEKERPNQKSEIISTTVKSPNLLKETETKIITSVYKIPQISSINDLWNNEKLTNIYLFCLPEEQFNDESIKTKISSFITNVKKSDQILFSFIENKNSKNTTSNQSILKEIYNFVKRFKILSNVYCYQSEKNELYSIAEKNTKVTFENEFLHTGCSNIYSNIFNLKNVSNKIDATMKQILSLPEVTEPLTTIVVSSMPLDNMENRKINLWYLDTHTNNKESKDMDWNVTEILSNQMVYKEEINSASKINMITLMPNNNGSNKEKRAIYINTSSVNVHLESYQKEKK